jgi:hypothetical protein
VEKIAQHQPQAAANAERQERAKRLRDYFSLQLRLAEVISEKIASPLAEVVLQYTNFFRRFGLGHQPDAMHSPEWQRYADTLNTLQTHEERVRWTQEFFRQSAPESLPPGQRRFGCFSVDPADKEDVVRIHFGNYENDDIGPLSHAKIDKRKQELKTMFTYIKKVYPRAKEVQGGSWLYNLEAYRRLFPPEYGDSREVLKEGSRLQGSSRWGQFLDHKGGVKPELREQFLENLKYLDMNRLWEVFPLPTFRAHAPIQAFYEYYGIEDEPEPQYNAGK